MQLFITDTGQGKKVPFEPIDSLHVRMYLCGPTVYDFAHVGNARPFVVFDVLYRLLMQMYPKVTLCRNITDIDDKINARAQEKGVKIQEITQKTIECFHHDISALNVLKPTVEPRATEYIAEMIEMIQILIDKGHAYEESGHVLFHVPSWKDYGNFARLSQEELLIGARVEIAPYKKDPKDFILWKPSDSTQPGWESPWGVGRPGWHIECSAMSKVNLGESFDIHAGGIDLKFPHHQNEIAQSVCATGKEFARYWIHNGYLMVNGQKMSKSLGNFWTVSDLLGKWNGEVIRLALLGTHYRSSMDLSTESLQQAKNMLNRLYRILDVGDIEDTAPPPSILEALCDDLNTPAAIAELNKLTDNLPELKAGAALLGILQQRSADWFSGANMVRQDVEVDKINRLIAKRNNAKMQKNFDQADKIRNELIAMGIQVEDRPNGTVWRQI